MTDLTRSPTTRNRLVANCIRFAPFTASLDDRGHAVRERAADALHGAGINAKLPGDHPHALAFQWHRSPDRHCGP